MNRETAIKVYKLALEELNGWLKEEADKVPLEDIEGDPFFERLKLIGGEE